VTVKHGLTMADLCSWISYIWCYMARLGNL